MSVHSEPGKRITLADVAREAGVSVQTASHVLSGNAKVRIPEVTRERVRAAAAKVGYRPNPLAQAMKSGRTNVISLWMPVDRPNPTTLRALRAVNAAVRADGFELMIVGLDRELAYELQGGLPTLWPVDGIIAFDAGRAIARLRENTTYDSIPVAVIGAELVSNGDAVKWELRAGTAGIVNRLIEQGCKRIAHTSLGWVLDAYPSEQRRTGYRETLEAAGLPVEIIRVEEESIEAAAASVEVHCASNGFPDAIVGFNDLLALGAMRALEKLGKSVPNDCKVWGYGDFPESMVNPVRLSTYTPPIDLMVQRAWELLRQRISQPSLPSRSHVVEMSIYERDSSG
jgi:DNA-binding LacI/PurR family transcriptional regulator